MSGYGHVKHEIQLCLEFELGQKWTPHSKCGAYASAVKPNRGGVGGGENSFEFVQKFHVDISIIIFLHFFLCSLLSLTLFLSLLFYARKKFALLLTHG